MRILLVEDDPDVGPLLAHVLLSAGYKVHSAGTVGEAEALLDVTPYDLVLTNGRLPDGSGLVIAEKAKTRGLKTLIVTGYALQLPSEELRRHEYMMKPVRPAELLATVKRLLG